MIDYLRRHLGGLLSPATLALVLRLRSHLVDSPLDEPLFGSLGLPDLPGELLRYGDRAFLHGFVHGSSESSVEALLLLLGLRRQVLE